MDMDAGMGLDGLVRPNFFCGQFVTDADLITLVEWTRKRLALQRLRDGWGIVCGLELACSVPGRAAGRWAHAGSPDGPVVYVLPGYAVDACGNDLVVCEPIPVPLAGLCRPKHDYCDDPPKEAAAVASNTGAGEEEGPFGYDPKKVLQVQLDLHFHEEPAQGQRVMPRAGADRDEVASCEYARLLERPRVCARVVPDRDAGEQRAKAADRHPLTDRMQQRFTELKTLSGKENPVPAMLDDLRRNPPLRLCGLEEIARRIETAGRNDESWYRNLLRLAGLMWCDWLLRELQPRCPDLDPAQGVPLGRVVLERTEPGGRPGCRVRMISSPADSRRLLGPDEPRVLMPGAVDLTPYLGQRWEDVDAARRQCHWPVQEKAIPLEEFINLPPQEFSLAAWPHSAYQLRALVVDDLIKEARVMGFFSVQAT